MSRRPAYDSAGLRWLVGAWAGRAAFATEIARRYCWRQIINYLEKVQTQAIYVRRCSRVALSPAAGGAVFLTPADSECSAWLCLTPFCFLVSFLLVCFRLLGQCKQTSREGTETSGADDSERSCPRDPRKWYSASCVDDDEVTRVGVTVRYIFYFFLCVSSIVLIYNSRCFCVFICLFLEGRTQPFTESFFGESSRLVSRQTYSTSAKYKLQGRPMPPLYIWNGILV